MVLTDGATPWPPEQPRGCKVIICIIGTEDSIAQAKASWPPPPWASAIGIPHVV